MSRQPEPVIDMPRAIAEMVRRFHANTTPEERAAIAREQQQLRERMGYARAS